MSSSGELWTNGTNGVLRTDPAPSNTLGRRRTKSGPKRVTFKLESDSPPKDVTSVAETDTTDGMPSWWPRAAQTAETTARTVENSPLVTSRPPPAVVISPPAVTPPFRNDLDPSLQSPPGSVPVATGVYYPNGSVSPRVSSPISAGNGHRDAVSPPPPIIAQNSGPPPIGSPDRGGVSSPPPISTQSRASAPIGAQDRVVNSTSPPISSLRRQPTPMRVVDQGGPSTSTVITTNVISSPPNQTGAPERASMPSWWPKQTPADVQPTVSETQSPSEGRSSVKQARPPPEPEYYDNTSPEWQARNAATSPLATSRASEPAVISPPPLPVRPWDRSTSVSPVPPVPPVPSRPIVRSPLHIPPLNNDQQVARVVTQANQSFLQSAKDVASLAPPLPSPPPDPDFTHPSEEDFWHLSPRPARRQPPTPDSDIRSDVTGRQVTSEATQTVVNPRPAVDDTWSRLLDVVTDGGPERDAQTPPGLHSRYRDTLRRRPEFEAASTPPPAPPRDWQPHEQLARQRRELEQLEQRRRQQQEEEQRRREHQLLAQQRDEERRRHEQQHFLKKQEEERRLFEERQMFEKQEAERRRHEEQQWLQKQQEERQRHEKERIWQQQEEERQRLERQQIMHQQEEERRRQQQERVEEQRILERQQLLQKEDEERRNREHEKFLQRQEEEQRQKRQEEEEKHRREQIRLQKEQEEEQRQLELQEQLQRELRNQHQQQWRQQQEQQEHQQQQRQRELHQQQQQVQQERQQVQQQQQRLAADWRREENPPSAADGLRRNVSLRESSRSVDLARRAGRVWDEEGGWVLRGLGDRAEPGSPAPGTGSAHGRVVGEVQMAASPRWDGAGTPHGATQRQTSAQREASTDRSESSMSGRRETSLVRSSPAPNSHRTPDSRPEGGHRRASFQQSFMSPPPGGYASPASPSASDPGLRHTAEEKDSGRSSPNPLDDELEICLKSVEEAMASLQDTVKKSATQRETGGVTARPELNRSFEMSPPGVRGSGDWRRRSCDGMELETYGRGGIRDRQRDENGWSADGGTDTKDVVSRQIALWEGQPAEQRAGPGPGQRLRGLGGPQDRAFSPHSSYRRPVDPESEGQRGEEVDSVISRIGMESRQKHRHITERMVPPSPGPPEASLQRYDSCRSSSTTPTPSPWQQSSASPPQSPPEPWRSGSSVRQSPAGLNGRDWNPRQSSGQPLSWQQSPPQELPWSAAVASQIRRANTLAETRSGSGFGRRPTLSSYQSQSATLPAGQPRSPAAWGVSERGGAHLSGSAQGSPVGPQMAAPSGHWAAPLSPSGSVASVDWNQLFETSSELSSCVDDELSSVSGEWSRPLSREEVVSWYQHHQLPRGVGVDALTGRAAPWFHGLVGRPEAEQRLLPCPPGAYLVRCSQRIWGYTLSYRSQKRCKHFLVEATEDGYRFYGNPERLFRTLDELLRHHSMQPITAQGGELLRFPCTNITNTPAGQLVM